MSIKKRIITYLLLLLTSGTMFVGYAAVSDHLGIRGEVDYDPPNYDTMVITEITNVSSGVASESSDRVIPTNISTSITGSAGQSVVYRVVAHNYSETQSYVYTGEVWSELYDSVADKLDISAATDEAGEELLPDDVGAGYASGTPVAPGEDIVFYVTYTLTGNLNGEEMLVRYAFEPVIYTITYLNDNEVWATDHVVDNANPYYVRPEGPNKDDHVFTHWVNANAHEVTSYPAGNTNSYTLSATWDSIYLIIFVDEQGNVLYQESFTSSTEALSDEGQEIVDAKLEELAAEAAADQMSVAWSEYDIANATADITVRPIYTYTGNLRFTPIDEDDDGIIDYYQVDAVSKLDNPTKIPGSFKDLPVKVINKLYLNDNNYDFGAGVTTIEIGEGVTTLNHNCLAYTSDLTLVKLPSTIEKLNKNVFSRNTGSDKKVLTVEFNGTMAEWQEIVNNSHSEWHNGLKDGSVIKCSDGYYELDRGFLGLGGYTWNAKSY